MGILGAFMLALAARLFGILGANRSSSPFVAADTQGCDGGRLRVGSQFSGSGMIRVGCFAN
jgi:hypothetical protein